MEHVEQATRHSRLMWWANLDALDAGLADRWLDWARSPEGVAVMRQWVDHHPALADWPPEELVGPTSGPATDLMQAALVGLAQSGSAEAGLTLLVQLRPGLVRLAQTAVHWEWIMSHDINEETQATFFEVLFRHSLERRPGRIAANLLLDTRQRLWRRQPRSGPPIVTPRPADGPYRRPGDTVAAATWIGELEVHLHLCDGVRDLPGSEASRRLTATMAYRAWIEGQPATQIASDLGVAPQTVSTRLYRLRRILRSSW